MPTESFSYIKPSVANGEHVALVSQAWGDPIVGKTRANAPSGDGTNPNIKPAGLFSTAPYVDPETGTAKSEFGKMDKWEREPEDPRYGKCIGNDDTCNAWATKTYAPFCNAHAVSEGRRSSWARKGE